MDLEATMGLFGRTDIQPCSIRVDSEPPCDLTAAFGTAGGGKISASIGGIPAGTTVKHLCLMSVSGEELWRWRVYRVIGEGDRVGVELDASAGFRWSMA